MNIGELSHDIIKIVIYTIDTLSITILVIGVLRAMILFIKNEVVSKSNQESANRVNQIKNYLGSYVLFSLEVLIAADIIETILNPSPTDVMILAAIVIIRTVISYFLGKEIEGTEVMTQEKEAKIQD